MVRTTLPPQLRMGVVKTGYVEVFKMSDHGNLVRIQSHFQVSRSVGVEHKVVAETAVPLDDVLELLQVVREVDADVEGRHFGFSAGWQFNRLFVVCLLFKLLK